MPSGSSEEEIELTTTATTTNLHIKTNEEIDDSELQFTRQPGGYDDVDDLENPPSDSSDSDDEKDNHDEIKHEPEETFGDKCLTILGNVAKKSIIFFSIAPTAFNSAAGATHTPPGNMSLSWFGDLPFTSKLATLRNFIASLAANAYVASDYFTDAVKIFRTHSKGYLIFLTSLTIPATITAWAIGRDGFSALSNNFAGVFATFASLVFFASRSSGINSLISRIQGKFDKNVEFTHELADVVNRIDKKYQSDAQKAIEHAFIMRALTEAKTSDNDISDLGKSNFMGATNPAHQKIINQAKKNYRQNKFDKDIAQLAVQNIHRRLNKINSERSVEEKSQPFVVEKTTTDACVEKLKLAFDASFAIFTACFSNIIFSEKFLSVFPIQNLLGNPLGFISGNIAATPSAALFANAGLDFRSFLMDALYAQTYILSTESYETSLPQVGFFAAMLYCVFYSSAGMGSVAENALKNPNRSAQFLGLDDDTSGLGQALAETCVIAARSGALVVNGKSYLKECDTPGDLEKYLRTAGMSTALPSTLKGELPLLFKPKRAANNLLAGSQSSYGTASDLSDDDEIEDLEARRNSRCPSLSSCSIM